MIWCTCVGTGLAFSCIFPLGSGLGRLGGFYPALSLPRNCLAFESDVSTVSRWRGVCKHLEVEGDTSKIFPGDAILYYVNRKAGKN